MIRSACVATALMLAACRTEPEPSIQATTVQAIVANPSQFYGETVVVSGELDRVWSEVAFTMTGGSSELLVVVPQNAERHGDAVWTPGLIVQVTGTVSRFERTELEDDPDIGPLGPDLVYDADAPVLVATEINATRTLARQDRAAPYDEADQGEEAVEVVDEDRVYVVEERTAPEAPPATRAIPVEEPRPRIARPAPAPVTRPQVQRPAPAPVARPRTTITDEIDRELDREREAILGEPDRVVLDDEDLEERIDERIDERLAEDRAQRGAYQVRIEDVIDEDTFVVRLADGRQMLVHIADEARLELSPGQELQLDGTVEQVPDEAMLIDGWGLDEAETERVRRHSTYLRATRISGARGDEPGT